MKIKFVSLSLSLLFSLPCLAFNVSAMDNVNYDIGETCSFENQHNEVLHCHFHTDKGLTKPENKEKKPIIDKIDLYKNKDALDCLRKLQENKQSSGTETICEPNGKNPFRLDQPSKISGDDTRNENKHDKTNNTKKNKKNKYRNSISSNSSTDSSSGESMSRKSSISLDEQSQKNVVVIINVQKQSNTYSEVIVDRSVLKYFDIPLDLNNSKSPKIDITSIPDADFSKKENIKLWVGKLKEWQDNNKSSLSADQNGKLNDFIKKYDNLKKGFKTSISKDWKAMLSSLSSQEEVNNLSLENVNEEKLKQFVDLVKKGLKLSLKEKCVMKIYFD